MRPILLLLAALAPLTSASARIFTGDAVTQSALGSNNDALYLRTNGHRVIGAILSNAFSSRVPLVGTLNAAGRLRLRIAAQPGVAPSAHLTGRFSGRLRPDGIRARGRASNDLRGPATFQLAARVTQPHPGGNGAPLPDLSGTRRLLPETSFYAYKSINFTFKKESAAEYSYRAVFAESRHGTDRVDARTPVPTGDRLFFSNSFEYRVDLVFFNTVNFRVHVSRIEEYYFTNNYRFFITLDDRGSSLGYYVFYDKIGPPH